jgi:hypothetical protein
MLVGVVVVVVCFGGVEVGGGREGGREGGG